MRIISIIYPFSHQLTRSLTHEGFPVNITSTGFFFFSINASIDSLNPGTLVELVICVQPAIWHFFLVNSFVANFHDALILYSRALNETIEHTGKPKIFVFDYKQVAIECGPYCMCVMNRKRSKVTE